MYMSKSDEIIDSLYFKPSVRDCIDKLDTDIEAGSSSSECGSVILSNGEEAQVQVIVTRKREEFKKPFKVEVK